ncbi:hypothetical protein Rleg_5721 (plasmid) [Rhizobium leguminosarum bv. trifolii WSM1325]|uniref:Uncharacterized protein n=1 Tax=Rhizobium leguminosarum bv. trifolii (strain WSM1325) TaxID=395491 RepID=C6B9D0_RHILS|nr:hypothetical protein Rleg_5721 [Rhizobium leguminosarum bv. trifolii WSM1325]
MSIAAIAKTPALDGGRIGLSTQWDLSTGMCRKAPAFSAAARKCLSLVHSVARCSRRIDANKWASV